jgi:transposase-like protein
MPQALLPVFPSDAAQINELVSCAKREGTVCYFYGSMPVFTHPEEDRASFKMFVAQLVVNANCTQSEIVRALGVSDISMKRYVKQYRQEGAASFFKSRKAHQPRVLTPVVLQKAQELFQQGQDRSAVAQQLGIKSDTLRKALKAGRITEPIKKKMKRQPTRVSAA